MGRTARTGPGTRDQGGKEDGLKKPVAYYQRLYNTNAMNSWFVEKGDFVKLRELSVRYSLNPDWLDAIFRGRVTGADLNLIGRNLYTFTDYTGYDPEVANGNGGSDVIGRIDSYQYPNFPHGERQPAADLLAIIPAKKGETSHE